MTTINTTPVIVYKEYWPDTDLTKGKLKLIIAGYFITDHPYGIPWRVHNIEDRPAMIFFSEEGQLASMHWRVNHEPKRRDLKDPTEVYYNVKSGKIEHMIYFDANHYLVEQQSNI